jgi:stage II sporulation protein AB (anti-sigma F factor)
VTNCIVHAYPDEVGVIMLKGKLFRDGSVEITIKDRGRGIADVEEARRPMFTTGGDERSGMGFTIMESFSDMFKIKSTVGKGTTVTMRKKFSVKNARRAF